MSHASVLDAGAGVAGAVLGLRFLLRVVGSSVLDVGDRRSDEGFATAEAEAESVSGIGQFHFGARPKFRSTSPVNHSPSTIEKNRIQRLAISPDAARKQTFIFVILAKGTQLETSTFLGYHATYSGDSLPTFRDN